MHCVMLGAGPRGGEAEDLSPRAIGCKRRRGEAQVGSGREAAGAPESVVGEVVNEVGRAVEQSDVGAHRRPPVVKRRFALGLASEELKAFEVDEEERREEREEAAGRQ